MGAVFEAVHIKLDRRAALKVLHAHLAGDPQIAARFLQEAKIASRLEHPGVVHIYEFGQSPSGLLYIVMEYLAGETMSARMRRAAQSPAGRLGLSCLLLMQQVARALASVHKQGFVHRDLKPGNVMIVADADVPGGERAKVLDFGIVKALQPSSTDAAVPVEVKTRTGLLMGTPDYMAPEQWRNQKQVDGKADVYSLGIMLFQAFTGRLPFAAEELPALGMMHCFEPAPPLSIIDPDLHPEVSALVMRMLEKDPMRRPTMAEVADGLGLAAGLPLASGAHSVIQMPVAPLSKEAVALLDAEHRTLDETQPGDLPLALAAEAPASNVPKEVAMAPTAPLPAPPDQALPNQAAPANTPTPQPTRRASRRMPLILLLIALLGIGTWATLRVLRPDSVSTIPNTELSDLGSSLAAPDLSLPSQPLPAVQPDMSRPQEVARHHEAAPARSRQRGVARLADAECILTPGMTTAQRDDLVSALKENGGIHFYPGERLVITGLPRKPKLLEEPSALKGRTLELFLNTLRGLESMGSFPAKVIIQCGK